MSGEAGGTIIGGILLIFALKYIVVAAAAAGLVYGLVKLGSVAVKAAAEARQREQVEPDNCSEQLRGMYDRLNSALNAQAAWPEQYYQRLEKDMEQRSSAIQKAAEGKHDTAAIEKMGQQAKEEAVKALGTSRVEEMRRIRAETEKETTATLTAIQEAQQARVDAVNWSSTTQAALAQQHTMTMELMRDAQASIKMLQTLANGSSDNAFIQQVNTLVDSYNHAAKAIEQKAYQAAASSAQRIISRSATIMLDHEQAKFEADNARIALLSHLEGLKEEVERANEVSFVDEFAGRVTESLDEFTQGEISHILTTIDHMLEDLHSAAGRRYSVSRLQMILEKVEDELIPHADEVLAIGRKKLLSYYERLHALEVISDHMREQGYAMQFAAPVGEDVTEKLIVNFRDQTSGNTISVTLDDNATSEDLGRMAMEVMTYYANGRPVTEAEKKELRDGITKALHDKGLGGSLSCTGSVGTEASDARFADVQQVQKMKPRRMFRDDATA